MSYWTDYAQKISEPKFKIVLLDRLLLKKASLSPKTEN